MPPYKFLTLKEKVELIRSLNGVRLPSRKIAEKWKIGRSQAQQILKNKDELLHLYQSGMNEDKLRIHKKGPGDLVGRAVLEWYSRVRSKNLPVMRSMMQKKAVEIARALKIDSFVASEGWFDRFKKRHNIVCSQNPAKQCGIQNEGTSADCLADWCSKIAEILEGYEEKDIFNADETGLYYRALPDIATCYKGKDCSQGELATERLTVLLCASMCGEKIKPMVIGKALPDECSKNINVNQFGVDLMTEPRAWMTSALMKEWLTNLNEEMERQGRKILLFLDNATCHVRSGFENIRIVFFPPNIPPTSQPLDQGIIQNFKIKYRQLALQHLIAVLANNSVSVKTVAQGIDILKASTWIERAWDDVSSTTIADCFKKAGFPGFSGNKQNDHSADSQALNELLKICPGLVDEDYVRIDENVCTESTSEDVADILAAVDPQNELIYKPQCSVQRDDENKSKQPACDGPEFVPIDNHTGALVELKRLQQFYMSQQDQKGFKMVKDLIMHHERVLSLSARGQVVKEEVEQDIKVENELILDE